jgi:hypothetical protein
VIFGQPLAQARRQQQLLLAITRQEVLRHARKSSLPAPDRLASRVGYPAEAPVTDGRCHPKLECSLTMEWVETELIESVKRLAAPADEQVAYLRRLGSFPALDELALEFNDMVVPARATSSNAPSEWVEALHRLDERLDAMSGQANAKLWLAQALNGTEWAQVRELARAALAVRPRQYTTT